MASFNNTFITLTKACAMLGLSRSTSPVFENRTGLKPLGKFGRAAVYDRKAVEELIPKLKAKVEKQTPTEEESLILLKLSTRVDDIAATLASFRTESSASYALVCEELNKIKLQLVEFAPK